MNMNGPLQVQKPKEESPLLDTRHRISLFQDRVLVSAGTLQLSTPRRGSGSLFKGLKAVVILSGKERMRIGGHPAVDIHAPQTCVLINRNDGRNEHWVSPDVPLRFALVQMNPSFVQEEIGIDIHTFLSRMQPRSCRPLVHLSPATRELQSLASQIIACPIQGAMRQLYLAGKALELMSLAMAPVAEQAGGRKHSRLSPNDMALIHEAYDLLIKDPQNPPSLAELAQQVGLNASKLTIGFRRVFGTTAFGVLQEHRLQQAYRMLSSGQLSVSEVAYRIGYAPAHFATVFRRRFGVSPSDLR